jgi:transposase
MPVKSPTSEADRKATVETALALIGEGVSVRKASIQAGERVGVSEKTVARWAREFETPLGDAGHERMKNARDERRLRYQANRALLRVKLAELALDLVERCSDDDATSNDVRNYLVSIGIAVDKCRLEEGKATERHESLSVGAVEAWLEEQEAQLGVKEEERAL